MGGHGLTASTGQRLVDSFYDGSWDDEANDKNELGANGPNTSQAANYPATGCGHDGPEFFTSSNVSNALGETNVSVGRPNASGSANGPLTSTHSGNSIDDRLMYGLSPLFIVVVPTTVRFGSTGYHAIEDGAETTVAVSMYPRPNVQVDIPLTVTNLGSTTAADYEIFVNGSQVSPGSLSLTFSPDDSGSGAGGIAQRFTVKAVDDSANDHRDSVKFGFGSMPFGTTIEGVTDGRAAKTATVWLLDGAAVGVGRGGLWRGRAEAHAGDRSGVGYRSRDDAGGGESCAGRGRRRAGAGRGGAAFRVRGVRGEGPPGGRRPQSGDRGEHRRAGVAVGVVSGRQGAPGRGEPEGRVRALS